MNGLSAHLPAIPVIIPLLASPLVVLLRQRGLAWAAATASSLFCFAVAITLVAAVRESGVQAYAVGSWAAPFGIELIVDQFSALLLLIVTGASSFALLIAPRFGSGVPDDRQYLFYTAWLLALAGLSGIVVSGDAFNIFVFMEISSLATYILIAGGPNRQALAAVFRYLIMGTIGATFYLIGVGYIYMMTGTLNLADMEALIQDVSDLRPVLVAGGFITVGLALKAAVFPLHIWLPNAYAHAPHAVTAFIAACSTKVFLYVLFRFDFLVFQGNLPGHIEQFSAFMMPLAIIAVLFGSAIALAQKDLKFLLAYSSVAQIGYIMLGASLVSVSGLTAGILHMFNHALAKGALFLAVACIGTALGVLSLDKLSGAARRMPWTFAAFVVAGLSLIGIPGTAGFVSKWYLVLAALELGVMGALLIVPVLIGSVMAVIYIWKVVEAAYFGNAGETVVRAEAPWWMVTVLWAAVLLNVWFGLQPGLPLELAREAAALLLEGQ
ncbi:MAG: monovalent cation/H+ antiporter subunit D family protein [Woeseia sp.]